MGKEINFFIFGTLAFCNTNAKIQKYFSGRKTGILRSNLWHGS
ncbi:hypothetical protein AQPE_0870 [Aquipluma nitroreducens]|uniref:Uncharacterized protein n=1 Tax=Aquipluma nitroreducens TaxID=2010828 RepID=A0A5K7S5F0_9BACT|nr:hypothetical protein [Aquipluma nitroreducens]BBE16727.1 hypothetical protein AQPE_0870 [Aquipluma nitroreducens]